MKKKKILFVATVVKTHIMEFHIPYLRMLKEKGWETAVAARNDYEDPNECNIPFCDNYIDIPFERNPFRIRNIHSYKELKKFINEGQYDIVHCHTPVGGVLARLAARTARKKGTKVIYTAHGFHFYKGGPFLYWLLFYPCERILAHLTDVLITINIEDYACARQFRAGKVEYVPGVGIDTERFTVNKSSINDKRKELELEDNAFVLLSVGELIPRKNHILVLNALSEIKRQNKIDNIHYLICGRGELDSYLKEEAGRLGLSDRVHFLGYRNDVSELCNASDLFVFMSLQEGLPVALMESMACGLPVICSNIRGNTDLITSGENGEIVEFKSEAVANAILELKEDYTRRRRYAEASAKKIKLFDIENVKKQVFEIYDSIL